MGHNYAVIGLVWVVLLRFVVDSAVSWLAVRNFRGIEGLAKRQNGVAEEEGEELLLATELLTAASNPFHYKGFTIEILYAVVHGGLWPFSMLRSCADLFMSLKIYAHTRRSDNKPKDKNR